MIRRDTRNPQDYKIADWMMMPRDYRFFLQVDMHDVIGMDARQDLISVLQRVRGVQDMKVYPGTNDPDQDLDNVMRQPWDDDSSTTRSNHDADPAAGCYSDSD